MRYLLAGVLLFFAGQALAQPYTATMGGNTYTAVSPSTAALSPSSGTYRWSYNATGLSYPANKELLGVVAVNDTSHAAETWFAQYTLSLAPGVYEIYGQWGHPNGVNAGYSPKRVGIGRGSFLNGNFVSPSAILETESDIHNPNDATFTFFNGATNMGTTGMCKIGEVSVWGGAVYVAAQAKVGSVFNGDRFGAICYRKIRDVPLWQKYIGGDIDVADYFKDLTANDGVSAVILPVEMLRNNGPASENPPANDLSQFFEEYGMPPFGYPTTQTGVVARYVQLTFNDARYAASGHPWRSDAGTPTFGWVIMLGRNGGLTARTVKAGLSNNESVVSYTWIQASTGVVGPPATTGQWYYEAQIRDRTRWVRYLPNGLPVKPLWTLGGGEFLSRFPYEDPDFYFSPPFKSGQTAGSGAQGNTAPVAPAVPGTKAAATVPGATLGDNPGFDPVITPPAGYPDTSAAGLVVSDHMRYPLHINHLRCVVQLALADPPVGDAEKRFVQLLDAWVQMCDGSFTPAQYRAQVAKGAADAVTLEEEEEVAAVPSSLAPAIKHGGWEGTDPIPRKPFGDMDAAPVPLGTTVNFNPAMAGIPSNPNLYANFSTDPATMASYLPVGFTAFFVTFDQWRVWIRAFQVFCIAVIFFYRVVSSLWMEI